MRSFRAKLSDKPSHLCKRLQADVPFGKWTTQTFIAGLRCDGITAPFVVDGAMDGNKFDA